MLQIPNNLFNTFKRVITPTIEKKNKNEYHPSQILADSTYYQMDAVGWFKHIHHLLNITQKKNVKRDGKFVFEEINYTNFDVLYIVNVFQRVSNEMYEEYYKP